MRFNLWSVVAVGLVALPLSLAADQPKSSKERVPFQTVDLATNEETVAELSDNSKVRLRLISVEERRDPIRDAIREARVKVEVDGRPLVLTSGTYHLPVTFAGIQIDCPVVKGYTNNAVREYSWGIVKDARFRLWPARASWINTEDFAYPVRQRWFAGLTQVGNEPTYVDGDEIPREKKIYYHYAVDFAGAEGMTDVLAPSKGRIISAGLRALTEFKQMPGFEDWSISTPSYDSVQILDTRGWMHLFYHLKEIDPNLKPGGEVALGQKIGDLGKEGDSGGFSHLHYEIFARQPSGLWGTHDPYAFIWAAYQHQFKLNLIAVARPHKLGYTGEPITLDGTKSWSTSGNGLRFEWILSDGTKRTGSTVTRSYAESGEFSEVLRVSDGHGHVSYDFAVVQVIDKASPDRVPPTIHCAYSPTTGIRSGDPVTFTVRSFRTSTSAQTWDFGDGSPKVTIATGRNVDLASKDQPNAIWVKDGYAVTRHAFEKPGDYIVRVDHRNEQGQPAMGHLWVHVEAKR